MTPAQRTPSRTWSLRLNARARPWRSLSAVALGSKSRAGTPRRHAPCASRGFAWWCLFGLARPARTCAAQLSCLRPRSAPRRASGFPHLRRAPASRGAAGSARSARPGICAPPALRTAPHRRPARSPAHSGSNRAPASPSLARPRTRCGRGAHRFAVPPLPALRSAAQPISPRGHGLANAGRRAHCSQSSPGQHPRRAPPILRATPRRQGSALRLAPLRLRSDELRSAALRSALDCARPRR